MNKLSKVSDSTKEIDTSNDKLLSVGEAASFAGVSTRTIERHATFTKYKTVETVKNGKKLKCYELSWLTARFKNVVSEHKQNPNKIEDYKNTTAEKTTAKKQNVVSESFLKEHLDILTKELQFKNDLIIKLQDSNNSLLENSRALLESEQKTKMLLADLQLQQKNLLLNEPTARQSEKKESKIWWALFFLLVAVCFVVLFFGVTIVQDLFKNLTVKYT